MPRLLDIWLIHDSQPGGADRVEIGRIGGAFDRNTFSAQDLAQLLIECERWWHLPEGELSTYKMVFTKRSDSDVTEILLKRPNVSQSDAEALISPEKIQ